MGSIHDILKIAAIDFYFIIWYKQRRQKTLNLESQKTMKRIESATPTLKANSTLRLVLRIVAILGYCFFLFGINQNYSSFVWHGASVVLFLLILILGGILTLNESKLYEYATNTTMTFLPKPAYVPDFWKQRNNAVVSIWGSLVFLALSYVIHEYIFFAGACALISFIFLVLHILFHPKRGVVHNSSNII
jgi:hypothetical protein